MNEIQLNDLKEAIQSYRNLRTELDQLLKRRYLLRKRLEVEGQLLELDGIDVQPLLSEALEGDGPLSVQMPKEEHS